MDEIEAPIEIPEDHPIRQADRYGRGHRMLRRWTLNVDGYPICAEDALDTEAASQGEVDAVQAANAALRAELGVPELELWVPPVPASVSRFQARAALHLAGLLTSVDAAIAASENAIAQMAWADAQVFERQSPTILALAESLGLNEGQLDELFRSAAKISA